MPVHTLTLRLDEETEEALMERLGPKPYKKPIAEVIREAILERGACVYFVRRYDQAVKIGFTGAIRSRLALLRDEVGEVTLVAAMPGHRAEEKALHKKLSKDRLNPRGEWFKGPGVEAEIQLVLAEWGPPDVDLLSGPSAKWNPVTTKLRNDELQAMESFIEGQNAKLAAEGTPATVTVSGFIRNAILQALKQTKEHAALAPTKLPSEAPLAPEARESEADDAPGSANGHRGSDETTLRPALHGRRVGRKTYGVAVPRQMTAEEAAAVRPGYVPSGPVPPREGGLEGPTGTDEPTAEELAAILEGTPGL